MEYKVKNVQQGKIRCPVVFHEEIKAVFKRKMTLEMTKVLNGLLSIGFVDQNVENVQQRKSSLSSSFCEKIKRF